MDSNQQNLDEERKRKRESLLAFLAREEPAWRDENHPELASGSAGWVRRLRAREEEHRSSRLKNRSPQS
jgi:hypothetical protein